MAKANGLASLPANLLRPSAPPESAEADAEVDTVETNEGQGGNPGPSSKPAAKGKRPRRQSVSTETRGRKLQLPDDIHDRLWMTARQRRTTVSAVVAEILDRSLPRWKVEREG